ncbi:hypothetical protein D3C79_832160 [compost metagenome]
MLPQIVVLDQLDRFRQLSWDDGFDVVEERVGQYRTRVLTIEQQEGLVAVHAMTQVLGVGLHRTHVVFQWGSRLVVVDDQQRLHFRLDLGEHLYRDTQVNHDDVVAKDVHRQFFAVLVSEVLGTFTETAEGSPGGNDAVITATMVQHDDVFHDGLRR